MGKPIKELLSLEGYEETLIFPPKMQVQQKIVTDKTEILNGFHSNVSGFGSSFESNDTVKALYEEYQNSRTKN